MMFIAIRLQLLVALVLLVSFPLYVSSGAFDQDLPDCRKPFRVIEKKTDKKALTCTMFRDEVGFLAEWLEYHRMHGFSHIILFDHGSTDDYLTEIQPWINAGFVTIYSNWSNILPYDIKVKKTFLEKMQIKSDLETYCIKQGISWNFDFFVSLDIDEYLMPMDTSRSDTVVDIMDQFYNKSKANVLRLAKYNFQQAPHTLEPVNLLTIEAYQTRMETTRAMTYFKGTTKKLAVRLNGKHYTNITQEFVSRCCTLHGCRLRDDAFCEKNKKELGTLFRKKNKYDNDLVLYHYSRSLEKYGLKSKTWETATGEDPNGYNVIHFMERNFGRQTDRSALDYSCQLRKNLAEMTKEQPFFRAGDKWFRNVEFGRPMVDPSKGRRNGAPLKPGFTAQGKFPDHYFGYYTKLEKFVPTF